jgi:ketosteroid isomerase-like protein
MNSLNGTASSKIHPDGMKLKIAETFLSALKNKDWDLMTSIISENASWTLPGASLLSGNAIGTTAVVDRAKKLRAFGVMVQLKNILYSFNGVALSLHNTATRGDLILDEQVVIVMELDENRISKLTTYLNDVQCINACFVEGII